MIIPGRSVRITIQIDTNRINARKKSEWMNQLEKWHEDEVIILEMSLVAHKEACAGSDLRRKKAIGYIYSETCARTTEEQDLLGKIESILFPIGAKTENGKNDIEIVFNSWKYADLLVTDDGGSKRQPGGILGNAKALAEIGIIVMRDCEAVDYIKNLIKKRDENTIKICENGGYPIPDWVGKD